MGRRPRARIFFSPRISESGDLRGNDALFQSTSNGVALKIRIRKPMPYQEGLGALRSLLPSGHCLPPPTAVDNWFRIQGWGPSCSGRLFPKTRNRVSGVLKVASVASDFPEHCCISHAGYDLLGVKEFGRRESICYLGYFWYDMHTVRGVGKKWPFLPDY